MLPESIIDAAEVRRGFLPMLVKVEVSADMLNPGDDLWVTSWWQNVGDAPAGTPLQGFMEMEYGHQRRLETQYNDHRLLWEPQPAPQQWQPGEQWATTCRWHIPSGWGGSFRLYLGFCDEEHAPITLSNGGKRIQIGEVDLGWSLGLPMLELSRKAWTKEFATPFFEEPVVATRQTVTLEGDITVFLDAAQPLLLSVAVGQATFTSPAYLPEVVLRDRASDTLIYSCQPACVVSYSPATVENACACYVGIASYHGKAVAQWTLRFAVIARQLALTLEDIREEPGVELLEVRLPSLLTADGDEARLVDFYAGGRLVAPDATRPISYAHHYDVRNAAALYTAAGALVVETPHLDDRLYTGVQENAAGKRAVLGVALVAKIRGRGQVASIAVQNPPRAEIELLDAGWGAPSWQAVARFLRRDLHPAKYLDRYCRTLVYKQLVTIGPQPEPWQLTPEAPEPVKRLAEYRTFNSMHEVMRRARNLIDAGPQVLYITGWQYQGFDTGYPYVYSTDPRVGTIEELRRCISEGPRYNAHVGMHDNYDDCYLSPHLDPAVVALDEEGRWWRGWIWAGGQSYITGFRKYVAQGMMQERVRKTVELYGFDTSYHLDVLSSEVLHYDFDPAWPAAADANMAAKFAVVDEFNKYGIDLTSETLTHPFMGRIGYAWSTRDNRQMVLFPGERYIPLTAMVYHGIVRFDDSGDRLWGIIRGAGARWSEIGEHEAEDVEGYYLQTLPLGFLCHLPMAEYLEDGAKVHVSYGLQSYVDVDLDEKTYRIVVEGRNVARNFTTFAPGFTPGSYLAYSLHGGELRYPTPQEWADGIPLRAVTLTGDGEGDTVAACVQGGEVVLEMPARTPVRIVGDCPCP